MSEEMIDEEQSQIAVFATASALPLLSQQGNPGSDGL